MAQIAGLAQSRMEFWRKHIEAQRQSGLGVAEYCRQRRLCPPTFYVWRRRLCENEPANTSKGSASSSLFQEVRFPISTSFGFVPSGAARRDQSVDWDLGISLAHETGWRVHLRRGFDEDALRRVLRLFSCPPDSQTRALHSLTPEAGSC